MQDIRASIAEEIAQVNELISQSTRSNIDLVNTIGQYAIIQPGRKMIRPMMIILFAKAIDYQDHSAIKLAAIIELIHSATLLHDDVIDHANVRRNKATTHSVFGGTQSILMGDFIYAAAFGLIAALHSPDTTKILSDATREIVEGEILQLSLTNNVKTSLDDYFRIIRAKTALLFSTGALCINKLSNNTTVGNAISDYAFHFGMLYQITDDILDIDIHNQDLNKAHGTDLREGKMTLPTILAYQHASPTDQAMIEQVILGNAHWEDILPIITKTKAIEHCQYYIQKHCQSAINALANLPPSIYKDYLINLIKHIPTRKK